MNHILHPSHQSERKFKIQIFAYKFPLIGHGCVKAERKYPPPSVWRRVHIIPHVMYETTIITPFNRGNVLSVIFSLSVCILFSLGKDFDRVNWPLMLRAIIIRPLLVAIVTQSLFLHPRQFMSILLE